MRIFIIAGEASGDLHGSLLAKELFRLNPNIQLAGWGGEKMKNAGVTIYKDYRELAFMGFVEVLLNIRTIQKNFSLIRQQISDFNPQKVVFIDYPGFNLRIAKWAKKEGFKTHYYISPQIWAWKEGRIKDIKADVDAMYVILPFEKDFYQDKHNFPVHFVGHPLIDAINNREQTNKEAFAKLHGLDQRPIIALLPGSRKQEIIKMLPIMLSVTPHFPNYTFMVAQAPGQDAPFYNRFLMGYSNVTLIKNSTYELLTIADAALVTSGTATLETALFKVPEVVCYKTSKFSYQIAKWLVKIKFISLVNLIMDKEIVQEIIQENLTEQHLTTALRNITENETKRNELMDNYESLHALLAAGGGDASAKVAQEIMALAGPKLFIQEG